MNRRGLVQIIKKNLFYNFLDFRPKDHHIITFFFLVFSLFYLLILPPLIMADQQVMTYS